MTNLEQAAWTPLQHDGCPAILQQQIVVGAEDLWWLTLTLAGTLWQVSWWNQDQPQQGVTCRCGCVVYRNAPRTAPPPEAPQTVPHASAETTPTPAQNTGAEEQPDLEPWQVCSRGSRQRAHSAPSLIQTKNSFDALATGLPEDEEHEEEADLLQTRNSFDALADSFPEDEEQEEEAAIWAHSSDASGEQQFTDTVALTAAAASAAVSLGSLPAEPPLLELQNVTCKQHTVVTEDSINEGEELQETTQWRRPNQQLPVMSFALGAQRGYRSCLLPGNQKEDEGQPTGKKNDVIEDPIKEVEEDNDVTEDSINEGEELKAYGLLAPVPPFPDLQNEQCKQDNDEGQLTGKKNDVTEDPIKEVEEDNDVTEDSIKEVEELKADAEETPDETLAQLRRRMQTLSNLAADATASPQQDDAATATATAAAATQWRWQNGKWLQQCVQCWQWQPSHHAFCTKGCGRL